MSGNRLSRPLATLITCMVIRRVDVSPRAHCDGRPRRRPFQPDLHARSLSAASTRPSRMAPENTNAGARNRVATRRPWVGTPPRRLIGGRRAGRLGLRSENAVRSWTGLRAESGVRAPIHTRPSRCERTSRGVRLAREHVALDGVTQPFGVDDQPQSARRPAASPTHDRFCDYLDLDLCDDGLVAEGVSDTRPVRMLRCCGFRRGRYPRRTARPYRGDGAGQPELCRPGAGGEEPSKLTGSAFATAANSSRTIRWRGHCGPLDPKVPGRSGVPTAQARPATLRRFGRRTAPKACAPPRAGARLAKERAIRTVSGLVITM